MSTISEQRTPGATAFAALARSPLRLLSHATAARAAGAASLALAAGGAVLAVRQRRNSR
jgi:hypothetical protein